MASGNQIENWQKIISSQNQKKKKKRKETTKENAENQNCGRFP
jgi:hypothetical protein